MTHYRERFLHEHMGAKIVGLAKRVSASGIHLRSGAERLAGLEVARLGRGEAVLFEDDVRAFLQQVDAIGGWDTNPNYVAIMEFLDAPEIEGDISSLLTVSPMRTQSMEILPEPQQSRFSPQSDTVGNAQSLKIEHVVVPEVLLQEPSPATLVEDESLRVVPTDAASEAVVSKEVSPPVVHDVVDSVPCSNETFDVGAKPVVTVPYVEVQAMVVPKKVRKSPPKVHPSVGGLRLQNDGFYWNPAWDK